MENAMVRFLALCIVQMVLIGSMADGDDSIAPIRRVVDLKTGETVMVELDNGDKATVKLIAVDEKRDRFRDAVREAAVTVEVNGVKGTILSGNYNLPKEIGGVQIDCPITRGYYSNTTEDSWGLTEGADARIRLWPTGSPWIKPGTFVYPAKQLWFASYTQMANEPVYVDGGEVPANKRIYYHDGLDIGGAEGMVDIVSATDGLVVSKAGEVLEGYEQDKTPVSPRYDVIYIRDDRGWYYRYSHFKSFETNVILGERVSMGQKLGELGKEGGSGGWSHFHFGVIALQPSGKWGAEEGYTFYWQSYRDEYKPALIAVARPHCVAALGDPVRLDASKSMSFNGSRLSFEWIFGPTDKQSGAVVERTYSTPGVYAETVKVTDDRGNCDYDFAVVNVIDPKTPGAIPPTIHPAYTPTSGIMAGDPVTFKVRVFRSAQGGETWDFGDGSPSVRTVSHPGDQHLPDGYAEIVHRFRQPGYYIVTVEHTAENGLKAVGRLDVRVSEPK